MPEHPLTLIVLPEIYSICRLPADAELPAWAATNSTAGGIVSITRTADELSLVCPRSLAPAADAERSDGWRCLRVAGSLDLDLVGILAPLLATLAQQKISVFTLATFDTDYLLVRADDLARAVGALCSAGHSVTE